MQSLNAEYPITTLDKQCLFPAGSAVAEHEINDMAQRNVSAQTHTLPLLSHGTIATDLAEYLKHPPYNVIFGVQEHYNRAMSLLAETRVCPAQLDFLDWFRKHDRYTYRHSLVVFALSTLIAQACIPDRDDLMREVGVGPSHDFGKLCVPLEVLTKSAPLTVRERRMLEHHAVAGYVLLSYHLGDCRCLSARIARDHHERRDASGYPAGIPLDDAMVEIVAVSDVYDALISARPYRAAPYDNRTALEEITMMAESGKVSMQMVQTMVACNRRDRPHFSECSVSLEKRGTPPSGNNYGVVAD